MRDRQNRLTLLALAVSALGLVAATCRRTENGGPSASPAPAASPDAGPPPAAAPLPTELPGIDLEALPDAVRNEFLRAIADEFCHCGCPHTIAGCLKEHAACKHARRAASLAGIFASGGDRASEVIASLGKYVRSFKPAGRKAIDLSQVACLGAGDAPVTIVEYADFECPSCAAARPMMSEVFVRGEGRIRLCFKNFPLQAHPHALVAAQAAEYAREKGKFWDLHGVLFTNQDALELDRIREYARRVGLDDDEMDKAIASGKYLPLITRSKDEGKANGVDATPSLYVNGRPLGLPISVASVLFAVEDEMEWKEGGKWHAD